MRKLVTILSLIVLAACGEKPKSEEVSVVEEPKNILENLTYTLDTVVVDPVDDIINLKQGITPWAISEDKAYFFHYTIQGEVLSIIDLNALRLVKQQVFEKEGPNAIVRHTTNLQKAGENQLMFIGLIHQGIYDFDGHKIKTIKFDPSQITGLTDEFEDSRHYKIARSKNREKYFSLPGGYGKGRKKFLVVDLEGNQGKVHDLPLFDFLSDYAVKLNMSNGGGFKREEIFLKQTADGNMIISNSAAGDIYLFDVLSDSLIWIPVAHTLVPNKINVEMKPQVQSMQEFEVESEKRRTQIYFEPFLYDDQSGYYFRFARIGKAGQHDMSSPKSDIYLFAYDKDFNLIGETKLQEFIKVPSSPFFKDGKLYSYVNVDDELGFAVFTFNF